MLAAPCWGEEHKLQQSAVQRKGISTHKKNRQRHHQKQASGSFETTTFSTKVFLIEIHAKKLPSLGSIAPGGEFQTSCFHRTCLLTSAKGKQYLQFSLQNFGGHSKMVRFWQIQRICECPRPKSKTFVLMNLVEKATGSDRWKHTEDHWKALFKFNPL